MSPWDLAKKLNKLWNMKVMVMVMPIAIGAFRSIQKGLVREMEELEIGEHRNNSILKIGLNTEKSTGGLSTFAVTQTLVKDHQLTLM